MPRTRRPATVPMPTLPDPLVALWLAVAPDGGPTFENRAWSSDPRPGCQLCEACRVIPLRDGMYACSTAVAPDDGPGRGSPVVPFQRLHAVAV